MPSKRHKPEEIVMKLRQVDVLSSQGKSMAEAIRSIGVTEVTYYRWRAEYVGLKGDQVKRLKELEAENARLRRAVSDLTLDKMILAEAAKGNFSLFGLHDASSFLMSSPTSAVFLRGSCFSSRSAFCRLMMGSEGVGGAI
jgi:transposase-like protein